ncbi:MAG: flagellin [Candidatus Eisenbacteria bacterium]
MTFRISTRALHDTISQAVLDSQQTVLQLQRGLADGRAIRKPSDDPVGTNVVMQYRERLRANEQYQKNMEVVLSHLNAVDSTMFMIQEQIIQAQSIQVRGADDSQGQDARNALAREIDQIAQAVIDLGNTRFAGVYIFGGTRTLEPAYETQLDESGFVAGVERNPNGIDGDVRRQVGRDLSLSIHVSGDDVFGEDQELFQTLLDLRDALLAGDREAIQATHDRLEAAQDQVLGTHTFVGSLLTRAEALKGRLQADEVTNESGRTRIEDIDVARALLDFNQNQVALEAALNAGSRILQSSLLNYM